MTDDELIKEAARLIEHAQPGLGMYPHNWEAARQKWEAEFDKWVASKACPITGLVTTRQSVSGKP